MFKFSVDDPLCTCKRAWFGVIGVGAVVRTRMRASKRACVRAWVEAGGGVGDEGSTGKVRAGACVSA